MKAKSSQLVPAQHTSVSYRVDSAVADVIPNLLQELERAKQLNTVGQDLADVVRTIRFDLFKFFHDKRHLVLECIRKYRREKEYQLNDAKAVALKGFSFFHQQGLQTVALANELAKKLPSPDVDSVGFRGVVEAGFPSSSVETIDLKVFQGIPNMEAENPGEEGMEIRKVLDALQDSDYKFILIDIYGYDTEVERLGRLANLIHARAPDASSEAKKRVIEMIANKLTLMANGNEPDPYHLSGGSYLLRGILPERISIEREKDESIVHFMRRWAFHHRDGKRGELPDTPNLPVSLQHSGPDRIEGFKGVLSVYTGTGECFPLEGELAAAENISELTPLEEKLAALDAVEPAADRPIMMYPYDGGELNRMFRYLGKGGRERVRAHLKGGGVSSVEIFRDDDGVLQLSEIPTHLRGNPVQVNNILKNPVEYIDLEQMDIVYTQ